MHLDIAQICRELKSLTFQVGTKLYFLMIIQIH